MTDLQIPDTVPARPGEAAAEGVDLRNRFASASVDMQTGQVTIEHKGVQRADSADVGTSSPVFSRVQSRSGSIEDATLDSYVSGPSIPGDSVRLRDALAAGFVTKNADGTYTAGPSTFGETAEAADADDKIKDDADEAKDDDKKDADDDTLEGLGDEVETVMNTLLADTNPHDQLAAVHQVAATGEVSEDLVQQVAQQMGVEPEALQGQLGTVIDAFETQARDVIQKVAGVDSETVLEWVREHRADQLQKAMVEQGTNRSTSGYAALANDFVAHLDEIDPDAILNATFPEGQRAVRENGKIVIFDKNGVGWPWKSAVAAGMVSIK